MTDKVKPILSRAPRYEVANQERLTVTIEKDDTSPTFIKAELVNLSVGGAKFKTSEVIAVKEVLAVKIEAKDAARTIAVSGEVRWITPGAGDDWSLGCSFDPQIPEEVLREFAAAGILERREYRRKPVSLRATAQWELKSETASVWMLNYSRGGFCLLAETLGNPGERTLLQLEQQDGTVVVIAGKTQWQVQSPEGFVTGCEFLDHRDYSVLDSLADSKPADIGKVSGWRLFGPQVPTDVDADNEPRQQRPLIRRPLRIVAICGAVLLCFLIAAIVMLNSPVEQPLLAESHTGAKDDDSAPLPVVAEAVPSPTTPAAHTGRSVPAKSVESLNGDASDHQPATVTDEKDTEAEAEAEVVDAKGRQTRPLDGRSVQSNSPRISPLVAATLAAEGQPTEVTADVKSWEVRIVKPERNAVETAGQAGASARLSALDGANGRSDFRSKRWRGSGDTQRYGKRRGGDG